MKIIDIPLSQKHVDCIDVLNESSTSKNNELTSYGVSFFKSYFVSPNFSEWSTGIVEAKIKNSLKNGEDFFTVRVVSNKLSATENILKAMMAPATTNPKVLPIEVIIRFSGPLSECDFILADILEKFEEYLVSIYGTCYIDIIFAIETKVMPNLGEFEIALVSVNVQNTSEARRRQRMLALLDKEDHTKV